ncbi:MAG: glycoside hydrolase family 75 protein, partial [Elusimicrobia bacterium]|nr:glycoside hydrolase family 75 protein [Elusimicrobiota bacterium]
PAPAAGIRSAGGGGPPGGDTQSAAAAASSFGRAAGSGVAGGATPGASRLGAMDANGVSSRAPGLNETPKLSGSSSGGGGGPGDLGGGGGAGKGGSGGMGGAVPGGTPTESAGTPAGVDAGSGGAAGAAGGASVAAGASGASASSEAEASGPAAKTGAPEVGEGVPSGKKFSLKPGGPAVIETRTFMTKKNVPLVGFTAKMAIDGDGPGGGRDGDPTYQRETALKSNGVSLNARVVPFIVIPGDFSAAHPAVKLGDYAAVTYGGKTTYAIVGDIGPKGVLGEGSPALARAVGINPSPVSGGVQSASVRYLIMPGTRKPAVPGTAAEIQSQVGAAFENAGAELR